MSEASGGCISERQGHIQLEEEVGFKFRGFGGQGGSDVLVSLRKRIFPKMLKWIFTGPCEIYGSHNQYVLAIW